MPGKKQDARVRYTKMVIKSSLMELMQAKPVAKITVTEICERAGINRATFYAHYNDPTDLLQSIERELIDDISDMTRPSIAALGGDLKESLTEFVESSRITPMSAGCSCPPPATPGSRTRSSIWLKSSSSTTGATSAPPALRTRSISTLS